MPVLLSDIPDDVLLDIITVVLLAEREAPPDLASASEHRVVDSHWPSFQPRGVVGRFEDVPYRANDIGLKLTNRRLSSLTAQALSHLQDSDRLVYLLDVAIVHEQELWPTWLCVPSLAITTNLVVRVQFRLFGARKRDALSALHFNASPRVILYGFYHLLEHLLRRGPLLRPAALEDRLISAKTLEFHFVETAPEVMATGNPAAAIDDWLSFNDMYCDVDIPDDVVQVMPRAEWFGELFMGPLEPMLRVGYHYARYGAILHERIGTIAGYNVGDYFASLTFDTFGHVNRESRLPAFWKWKMETLALRRQLGLPIGDPVAMPPEGMLEPTSDELITSAGDALTPSPAGSSGRLSRLRLRARKLIRLVVPKFS
ncbi:hypothetical protein AURDEDRAFT_168658 [Auricularia subglabra TFB-10046 SS5]|nr:hypothetical protein AURDEDRAFT_168658 [Auricularia subglabra TFB-10046 SS5]